MGEIDDAAKEENCRLMEDQVLHLKFDNEELGKDLVAKQIIISNFFEEEGRRNDIESGGKG